jgi:hypothetical protein
MTVDGSVPESLQIRNEGARAFLQQVQGELARHQLDAALDTIFQGLDERFRRGAFDDVNYLLPLVEVETLEPEIIVGFLSASFPGREHLSHRADLIRRARARLLHLRPEEEVNRLLQSLT